MPETALRERDPWAQPSAPLDRRRRQGFWELARDAPSLHRAGGGPRPGGEGAGSLEGPRGRNVLPGPARPVPPRGPSGRGLCSGSSDRF